MGEAEYRDYIQVPFMLAIVISSGNCNIYLFNNRSMYKMSYT